MLERFAGLDKALDLERVVVDMAWVLKPFRVFFLKSGFLMYSGV